MKIKQLYKNSNRWVSGAFAHDKNGNDVSPLNPKAYSFCLIGAIQKCYRDRNERKRIYRRINNELKKDFIYSFVLYDNNSLIGDIVHWNDREEFESVQKLVNKLNI